MNPLLRSTFTDDECEQAGAIGEDPGPNLIEKVAELFQALPDPLLSAGDVREMLGTGTSAEVENALGQLEGQSVLESSTTTQRPFDPSNLKLFRLADHEFGRLILTALEAQLSDGTSRYQFTCDGRLIRSIAEVDRLNAEEETGQQRPEIRKHIDAIAEGIESGTQVPNSILLTLIDEKVQQLEDVGDDDGDVPESWTKIRPISEWLTAPSPVDSDAPPQRLRLVEIDFPFRRAAFDDEKTALLVDGQQRTAAIALVSVDKKPGIDLSVNAMITGMDDAKVVFRVANNARPIPNDFKLGLLASMDAAPGFLQDERVRALATKELAIRDEKSPFYHIVRYPGYRPSSAPTVVYNSLFQVVRAFEKAKLPGVETPDGLAGIVSSSFDKVKNTWPGEWGRRPQDSKLMHGAGLRAMAEVIAWWLSAEVGVAASEISGQQWTKLSQLLDEMSARIAWSDEGASQSTNTAAAFYAKSVAEKQNTNQDVSKLFGILQDVVKSIAKSMK